MSNPTGPAAAEGVPPFIENLGRRLAAVRAAEERYGAISSRARRQGLLSVETYAENAEANACDQADALREAITSAKATTLVEAGIQVVEAINLVDRLTDMVDPENLDDREKRLLKKDKRAVDRVLFSVLACIEAQAGTSIESVLGEAMQMEHCDPWNSIEKRCSQMIELREDAA